MNISKFYAIPTALAIVLLVAPPALAAESWLPKVGYSADVTMKMGKDRDGNSMIMTGKVYGTPEGNERREMAAHGRKMITIRRHDVIYIVNPEEKIYWESRGGKEKDPERMMQEGDVKITDLGWETVNGTRAKKQRIEVMNRDGDRFNGHRWVTKDNVPVRMEGTTNGRHFRIDYTHITTGAQDPGLFSPPHNYRRLASPGMPGGLPSSVKPKGQMPHMPQSRPPGMTKDQWEQMKKLMEQMQKQHGGGN
jgi:hypothetical protein